MHLVQELILKKRDGISLSEEEIRFFIEGVASDEVSDAQIAAFTMATWFRGMIREEQMALTLAMRDSGQVLRWDNLHGPVVDKHSTGGVGDMVSLLLGPIVASCGAYVPMISGRGLGHTGGTLDKLESIPGFEAYPGIDRFQQWVRSHHLAIVGQTNELASADRRIYAIRDVTATVASPPLIISSILSKKLAEGLDALVMDIKFGSGAFTPAREDAISLARELSGTASEAGLPCHALVTAMDEPLAWTAGNALEVMEAIRFLRGEARHPRLASVAIALSAEVLLLSGLAENLANAREQAIASIESGRAAEQFATMVAAQGGPGQLLQDPGRFLPRAPFSRPVTALENGYIGKIDTRAVGTLVVFLGGGRRRASDPIDHSVGISDISGVGQKVDRGSTLAVIHADSKQSWEQAAARLRAAVTIGPERVESTAVIDERVRGESFDANH